MDLANRTYVRWDDPNVENKPEGEDGDIQVVVEMVDDIQKAQYNCYRYCYPGSHARTQGIVKGTLRTERNLPTHLKQSMFAEEREWPVLCRYSSESANPGLDDRIPQPRGFAMKVFDVQGEMFEEGRDIPTHDFEFNSSPTMELWDARTAREIIELRVQFGHDPEELHKQLELRRRRRHDVELQIPRGQDVPPQPPRNTPLESLRQFSQTAHRFGDYMGKFRLSPNTSLQLLMQCEAVQPHHPPDVLHRWLRGFHLHHPADWLLQVQLCEDLTAQPVEEAGRQPWDPARWPWQTVARLHVPAGQDSFDLALKQFWEDHMRLDPWLGLTDLQPLGGVNRLRRVLYPASSRLRRSVNGVTEVHVRSLQDLSRLLEHGMRTAN